MFINDYQYEEYAVQFDCPDGDLAVTVRSAKVTATKTGNQMLEISLDVERSNGVLYIERYVAGYYFNKNMSRFFDAFGIQRGNFNFQAWIGKRAAGHFEHQEESYNGKTQIRARLKYLLVDQPAATAAPQAQYVPQTAQPNAPQVQTLATPAEAGEILSLLAAKYQDGSPVFADTERRQFQTLRERMSARELIDHIKGLLMQRISNEPLPQPAQTPAPQAAEQYPIF